MKKYAKICSPSGTKANVMGENCGTIYIVVSMDCISSIDDGNAKAGLQRPLLQTIDHVRPISWFCILKWFASTPTQDTPCISNQLILIDF